MSRDRLLSNTAILQVLFLAEHGLALALVLSPGWGGRSAVAPLGRRGLHYNSTLDFPGVFSGPVDPRPPCPYRVPAHLCADLFI